MNKRLTSLGVGLVCTLAITSCANTATNTPTNPRTKPAVAVEKIPTQMLTKPASRFALPAYDKVVLDNGLTLLLMEQHEVPLIDFQVTVRGGALEDGQYPGLAAMTAESLMFGSQSLDKAALENQLDFIGAKVNTDAGKEFSELSASFAANDQGLMLPLLRDLLLLPNFDNGEFKKFKQRYLLRLKQQKESPKAVISNYFGKLLYGEHAYASVVDGNSGSVEQLSIADIKAFHQGNYQPQQTTISVVGDFDRLELKQQLEGLFSSWKPGTAAGRTGSQPLAAPVTPKSPRVLLVNKADANETTFYIGGLGVPRNHPDNVALQVINTALGGRFTSWLNDELRVNSGLTYGANSRFVSYSQAGWFRISTFTRTEKTREAIDLALTTYDRLWQQGLDQTTLDSAKAYVKGQFPPRYETSEQLAGLLGQMDLYGFDDSYINDFERQVDSLTPARIKEVIARHFPRKNLQFVLIGQADAIRDIAANYGEVVETDISHGGFSF